MSMLVSKKAGFDVDAQAFITASGISSTTEKNAINQLVISLKGYSIWTKMKAIYPMVGSSAGTCKWNLKDPRDLDAAFRLVFTASPTFSSTGVDWNGTTQYADTKLIPSANLTLNSTHLSYYTSENVQTGTDIGEYDQVGDALNLQLLIRYTDNNCYTDAYAATNGRITFNHTNSAGFWISSRTASNAMALYKAGSSVATIATSGGALNTTLSINIGRSNSTSPLFSTRQCGFASIGDGLSSIEAANFNTAVQAFLTALSR